MLMVFTSFADFKAATFVAGMVRGYTDLGGNTARCGAVAPSMGITYKYEGAVNFADTWFTGVVLGLGAAMQCDSIPNI